MRGQCVWCQSTTRTGRMSIRCSVTAGIPHSAGASGSSSHAANTRRYRLLRVRRTCASRLRVLPPLACSPTWAINQSDGVRSSREVNTQCLPDPGSLARPAKRTTPGGGQSPASSCGWNSAGEVSLAHSSAEPWNTLARTAHALSTAIRSIPRCGPHCRQRRSTTGRSRSSRRRVLRSSPVHRRRVPSCGSNSENER